MSPPRIHVAVVHDNFLTRVGLTATFAACEDMAVRSIDLDGAELLGFDVAVADLRSGLSVLEAARRDRAHARGPRVVIVASSDLEWQIRQAVKCGAAAYMLLGATGEELVGAVRSAHEGGCHLPPSIAAKLARSLTAESLTARDEEVLALVTEGLCNKLIAKRLGIAVGTVKTHLRAAFDKLQIRSRVQAVVMAKGRGPLRHGSASTAQVLARPSPSSSSTSLRADSPADGVSEFDTQRVGTVQRFAH
jgi:DNA-binding NarL/FixJ family response regulator